MKRVIVAVLFSTAVSGIAIACGGEEEAHEAGNEQGRQLYMTHCSSCHGEFGRGNGPAGPALGATNLTEPRVDQITDAQISERIHKGGTKMPPIPQLSDEERAQIIEHVRTL